MFDPVAIVRQLLASAVNGAGTSATADISVDQWKLILGVCAAQNVHTLVFDVLPDNVPDEVMDVWRRQVDKVAVYNRLSSRLREAQEKAWKAAGVDYALLKGESIASLYTNPERRGSGDIDWFFRDSESWDKAVALAEKNAEDGLHEDSDGDLNFFFKGVVVEYHRDWTHLSSRKLRRIAGVPTITDGRLSPEDTLLMLVCHILHHLAYAGMGLKQFADLSVALKAYDGKYDKESLSLRLEKLGLLRWSSLLFGSLVELFGIEETMLPASPSRDRNDIDTLVRIIFEDGCAPGGRRISAGLLFRKLSLMGRYCPREMAARYYHLLVGRLCRKMFDQ